MGIIKNYNDLISENTQLRDGLDLIAVRCDQIKRPNGTTKLIARIAVAALTGSDIIEAAARKKDRTIR